MSQLTPLDEIARRSPAEICLACQHANSPRVDDVPFCSSCVEAGWGVAFVRGVQAAVDYLAQLKEST